MDPSQITGAWVRARRQALALTQQALADQVGYSVDMLRKVERGTKQPSAQLRQRLLTHLTAEAVPVETAPDSFAAWLGPRRKALDWTQAQLADLVGCATTTIRHLEDGTRRPSPPLAAALAALLAVPEPARPAFVAWARGRATGHAGPPPPLPVATPGGPSNLPAALTAFVGRAAERADLVSLLNRRTVRLVTLTGVGGVGKTRLAQEVATAVRRTFRDGIWWVDLTAVRDAAQVPAALAAALAVQEAAGQSVAAALTSYLRARQLLLLLDNFEQVVAAAPLVSDWLTAAPDVKVLVTSRRPLQLVGEQEYAVGPFTLDPVFPDGAAWVTLPDTPTEPQVLGAVSRQLGVPERADQALADRLAHYLHAQCRLLVVVCTQLERELLRRVIAPQLELLTAAAPSVQILLTDYQTLWLPAGGPAPDTVAAIPAVALVLARVQARQPHFPVTPATLAALAAVCARVDGLPLALELAAGRSTQFPPAVLLGQLTQRLTLLTGGGANLATRHQTLRALLDWSYDLLDPPVQRLFAACAVFVDGWTEDAAAAVCPALLAVPPAAVATGLLSLTEQSLIQIQAAPEGPRRYRMLETIREYAADRLTALDPGSQLPAHHAAYFRDLAVAQAQAFTGPGQLAAYHLLQREHANLRLALQTALTAGDGALGGALAGALWPFWRRQGYWSEGRAWLAALLDQRARLAPLLTAQLQEGAGVLTFYQGDLAAAEALLTATLQDYRRLGALSGTAAVLNQLSTIARRQGDRAAGRRLLDEALALYQALADPVGKAETLYRLGTLAYVADQLHEADHYFAESLHLFRTLAHTEGIARALHMVAAVGNYLAEPAVVRAALEESLTLYRLLGDSDGIGRILMELAQLRRLQEDYAGATALYTESLALMQELGAQSSIAGVWLGLGQVAADQAQWARAQEFYARSLGMYQALGHRGFATELLVRLGDATWPTGALEPARAWYEQGLTQAAALQVPSLLAAAWFGLGQVARQQRAWAEAQAAYARSWQQYQATDVPGGALRVLVAAAAVAHAQGATADAQRLYQAATCRMQQGAAQGEPQDRAEYAAVGAQLAPLPPDHLVYRSPPDNPLLGALLAGPP